MQQSRRNMLALLAEGAFFFTAFATLDTNVVVPVFLEGITGNRDLVGVAATVRQVGFLLPTLFMAGLMHRVPDIRPFLLSIYIGRTIPIALVAVALLVAGLPPVLIASLFLLAMAIFMIADGASQLGWIEMLNSAVPGEHRGRLIGWIQAVGGLGALAMGLLVTRMLENPVLPFRTNFAVLFGIATLALLGSALGFGFVRVGRVQVAQKEGARFAWWSRIPALVRGDARFVRHLTVQALMASGLMGLPFYALYLKDAGAIPPDLIGLLNVTQVLGGVAGGFLLGWYNDRFGPAATLRLCSAVNIAVPALAMAAGALGAAGAAVSLLTFVLIGVSMGVWLPQVNYLMGLAPAPERPYYFATSNLNGAALSLLPMLSGFLVQHVPYTTVFWLVLGVQVLGFLTAMRLAEVGAHADAA